MYCRVVCGEAGAHILELDEAPRQVRRRPAHREVQLQVVCRPRANTRSSALRAGVIHAVSIHLDLPSAQVLGLVALRVCPFKALAAPTELPKIYARADTSTLKATSRRCPAPLLELHPPAHPSHYLPAELPSVSAGTVRSYLQGCREPQRVLTHAKRC